MMIHNGLWILFVRAENAPNSFKIKPAKSILIFDLSIVGLVILFICLSPIISSVKLFFIALVVTYGLVTVKNFRQSKSDYLDYLPQTNSWLHNRQVVYLQPRQFLTAHLVILYFRSVQQKNITQVIPADSMPKDQHIRLRKLIIAWSRTTNQT